MQKATEDNPKYSTDMIYFKNWNYKASAFYQEGSNEIQESNHNNKRKDQASYPASSLNLLFGTAYRVLETQ